MGGAQDVIANAKPISDDMENQPFTYGATAFGVNPCYVVGAFGPSRLRAARRWAALWQAERCAVHGLGSGLRRWLGVQATTCTGSSRRKGSGCWMRPENPPCACLRTPMSCT
jgi:hypothetical protein